MSPAPSSLGLNYSLIFQWVALVSGLVFLCYAATSIKKEKLKFVDESIKLDFFCLTLLYPRWWSKNLIKNGVRFVRSDTRYNWFSEFTKVSSQMDIKDFKTELLLNLEIELDGSYESLEITEKSNYLFKNDSLNRNIKDFYRIESVGTQEETDRIYFDLVLFKLKNHENEIYQFLSISSVLNGCVEGPFFEECLKSATYSLA